MLNSLSGRFLILTTAFVMLAEVLIFVPSVSRFRLDYLENRLERAQIASLALLADDMIDEGLEDELLANAEVYNVVLRRDQMRQLALSSPIPQPISATYDLRGAGPIDLIRDAMMTLLRRQDSVIRVIGAPTLQAGELIEITMSTGPLRDAMIYYGVRILILSAVISVVTALLLFLAVRRLIVLPIKGVVQAMESYADQPEDARRIMEPTATVRELRAAEATLAALQTQLTQALRQKERLAQLGGAVAKISHDLRNVLTTAQLFADRLEGSEDPTAMRLGPKLVNSLSRAIAICEGALAFGRADEPPPALAQVALRPLAEDVVEGERLASEGSGVTFALDVPATLHVRADPEQLHRVILNLVRNARQALVARGQGGEIAIRAEETEAHWAIRVCDTGPGLPPRARDHLFQPFQASARKGGTGLGLSISHDLVRGHGGDLKLVETGEGGTVFEVCLPKAVVRLDAAE